MTKEEAIAYGKRVIDLGLNDETQAFCEIAIKALEEEPVIEPLERLAESASKTAKVLERLSEQEQIIDKIRAEIESEMKKDYGYDIATAQGIRTGYLSTLSIIDKYRKGN